jgi:hypothetical protein
MLRGDDKRVGRAIWRRHLASPTQVVLRAHTCMARSVVAVGYWTSTSLTLARRQSLVQCALRTPRAYACYVVSCS